MMSRQSARPSRMALRTDAVVLPKTPGRASMKSAHVP